MSVAVIEAIDAFIARPDKRIPKTEKPWPLDTSHHVEKLSYPIYVDEVRSDFKLVFTYPKVGKTRGSIITIADGFPISRLDVGAVTRYTYQPGSDIDGPRFYSWAKNRLLLTHTPYVGLRHAEPAAVEPAQFRVLLGWFMKQNNIDLDFVPPCPYSEE